MAQIEAGIASIDITPPAGLQLAGFAARTEPAIGAHDPLTARALVIGDSALVVADVVGIDRQSSERIRNSCGLPPDKVVVAATHTHGAPHAMRARLGTSPDRSFVERLEQGCINAIRQARATARTATVRSGWGQDPSVARNRRHENGPVDTSVPVLQLADAAGDVFGVLTSYACHPTVLGADNRSMTADYVHFVRDEIETAFPGAIAIFAQGCAGDVNIGHLAKASWTTAPNAARSFENAERIGRRIGRSAVNAPLDVTEPASRGLSAEILLELDRPETDLAGLAQAWSKELEEGAHEPRSLLLPHWIAWARANCGRTLDLLPARVTVLDWGGAIIAALPGEVFVETGLEIRAACGERPAFVLAYADDTPGYIPTAHEYRHGGYEVAEAHRYFGLAGRIAPGSAERLAAKAIELIRQVVSSPQA